MFKKLMVPGRGLTEPLGLQMVSRAVSMFGTFEEKVAFDLVWRAQNAFGLLQAAKFARRCGSRSFMALEFGVANGAGLMNMATLARDVTASTGMEIELIGFDTGAGMPAPVDYRDHPELYTVGDFPMQDFELLRSKLPANARLVVGNLKETIPRFMAELSPDRPIGYAAIDVDYYSSTVDCLRIFDGDPDFYLPETILYLDDIRLPEHNPWQGEYLAVGEFNDQHELRKICRYNGLRQARMFQHAAWIDQIYLLHVLDHRCKCRGVERPQAVLGNRSLGLKSVNHHQDLETPKAPRACESLASR